MYYYIAIDKGKSNNNSLDTHDLIWTPFDDVYKTLSYDSLKKIWSEIKELVLKIIENNKWLYKNEINYNKYKRKCVDSFVHTF